MWILGLKGLKSSFLFIGSRPAGKWIQILSAKPLSKGELSCYSFHQLFL